MKTEIDKFKPCSDAMEFRRQFNSFQEAWEACPRGDWMLWIAYRLKVDKRVLTLAKGRCAETVIHLMKDQRSKDAVKVAIDYGNGLIDDKQLKDAAADAAYAAYAAAAADAADAADAAYAAYAAYAYVADAYDAARKENQLQTANICREILTEAVFEKLNNN